DIVETLKEMVQALEKAIRDNQNSNQPPPPPGPNAEPPLVNLLQQLKMVYALQRRVNARTELYGRRYPGEQLPSARAEREKESYELVRKELLDLSGRQDRIAKVTKELGRENPGVRSKE